MTLQAVSPVKKAGSPVKNPNLCQNVIISTQFESLQQDTCPTKFFIAGLFFNIYAIWKIYTHGKKVI